MQTLQLSMAKQNRATKSMPLLQTIHKTKMTPYTDRDRKNENARRWREKNKEKVNEKAREWAKDNKDRIKKYRQRYLQIPGVKEKIADTRRKYLKNPAVLERTKEKRKKWIENNKDKIRLWRKEYKSRPEIKKRERAIRIRCDLKRMYGISLDEYNNLLCIQDYKCAICGKNLREMNRKSIHVDHCHSTNKVRGILCTFCNTGLGMFNDDEKSLFNAIEYLKRN